MGDISFGYISEDKWTRINMVIYRVRGSTWPKRAACCCCTVTIGIPIYIVYLLDADDVGGGGGVQGGDGGGGAYAYIMQRVPGGFFGCAIGTAEIAGQDGNGAMEIIFVFVMHCWICGHAIRGPAQPVHPAQPGQPRRIIFQYILLLAYTDVFCSFRSSDNVLNVNKISRNYFTSFTTS